MDSAFLDKIPFFTALDAVQRTELVAYFSTRTVAAGQVIFWVGEQGHEFFVVQSGYVLIVVPDDGGKEITLAELGPGAVFGEIALLDSGPRTATARARTDSTLLTLERSAFDAFMIRYPAVSLHVMRVLGKRQRETVEKLRGISNLNEIVAERQTTWHRLANAIASLASSQWFLLGHVTVYGSWILLNLTNAIQIDPFPFLFLCFFASTESIFLSLFILVSQDQQSRKDRVRTELEYQVALKTHVEMMQLHQKLDRLLESTASPTEARTSASGDGESRS